jgi:arginase
MSKKILFVSANSRLGLLNPPNGERNPNSGVETGPSKILSTDFLKQFPHSENLVFDFSAPEKCNPEHYLKTVANDSSQLISAITTRLSKTQILVTVGGDHSIAFASIASVLQLFEPSTTGIIMIDSHGDIHQPSTSPSGNFHGMWLRPIVDQFEHRAINQLVPKKALPKNLMFIGNLDIEPAEKKYIEQNKVTTYDRNQVLKPDFTSKIENFVRNMSHIHLSIDVDAFTHTFAPATGMHIENGLHPSDVYPVLDVVKNCPSLSIDLVEVNPLKEGSAKTIDLAQELLKRVL